MSVDCENRITRHKKLFLQFYTELLTVAREVHSAQFMRANELFAQISVPVHEYCRQIFVRIVRYTDGRNAFQELCSWKLARQVMNVLLHQFAHRHSKQTRIIASNIILHNWHVLALFMTHIVLLITVFVLQCVLKIVIISGQLRQASAFPARPTALYWTCLYCIYLWCLQHIPSKYET